MKDRLLRTLADFENFRRRAERDRSEYVQYAATEMVRDLIPILDDFRRAVKVETADKEYAKGIELIDQRLFEALKKAGVKYYYVGHGKDDPVVRVAQGENLAAQLEKVGINYHFTESSGGHTWSNWRIYLNEFAPKLFQ